MANDVYKLWKNLKHFIIHLSLYSYRNVLRGVSTLHIIMLHKMYNLTNEQRFRETEIYFSCGSLRLICSIPWYYNNNTRR